MIFFFRFRVANVKEKCSGCAAQPLWFPIRKILRLRGSAIVVSDLGPSWTQAILVYAIFSMLGAKFKDNVHLCTQVL